MFKLRFRSWLNEGPEIHKLAEGVEKHIFDDKKIKDLQAEFNLLMKNASKISDPNQLELYRHAIIKWRTHINNYFASDSGMENSKFGDAVRKDLANKYPSSSAMQTHERLVSDIDKLSKLYWMFTLNLALPQKYLAQGEEQLSFYKSKANAWERSVRRRANLFWKELQKVLGGNDIVVDYSIEHKEKIEGFNVIIQGYTDARKQQVENFKDGLKVLRKGSEQRMPIIIDKPLPIKLSSNCKFGKGGEYFLYPYPYIWLCIWAASDANQVAYIVAHEYGHHLYYQLSKEATKYWESSVFNDYKDVNYQEILDIWPEDMSFRKFNEWLQKNKPAYSIYFDVLAFNHSEMFRDKKDFKDFAGKYLSKTLPTHPISWYATTNGTEAFCEAFALYTVYGSKALYPIVEKWLRTAINF